MAGDQSGVISLPPNVRFDLKPGDENSARGFVTKEESGPKLFLAAADALEILKRAAEASATTRGFKLPPSAAAGLTAAALAVGLVAYLRNERLKRLSLVRREGDLPLE